MNIYLDIDGTLVHEDGHKAGQPAAGLAGFLLALRPHETFWLTTHCMDGNPEPARAILKGSLPREYWPDIERIQPTKWTLQKTEAIDFTKQFIWFDDTVMDGELKVLKKHAVGDKQWFVQVDLESNPRQLVDIVREYFTRHDAESANKELVEAVKRMRAPK
jgi:hypothetical protein